MLTGRWLSRGLPPLGFAFLFAVGCSEQPQPEEAADFLPPEIHGLQLAESRSGTAAVEMINRLHGVSVAPPQTQIGFYGPPDMRALLYVSRFASSTDAESRLAVMAGKIEQGTPAFGHYRRFDVGRTQVNSVFGGGQVHYFFTRGAELTWLAVPPQLARAALAELLAVDLESVPTLAPAGGGDR